MLGTDGNGNGDIGDGKGLPIDKKKTSTKNMFAPVVGIASERRRISTLCV